MPTTNTTRTPRVSPAAKKLARLLPVVRWMAQPAADADDFRAFAELKTKGLVHAAAGSNRYGLTPRGIECVARWS